MAVMDNLYMSSPEQSESHYLQKKNIFVHPKYFEDVTCKKRPKAPSKIFAYSFFFGMLLIMVVSLIVLNSEFEISSLLYV